MHLKTPKKSCISDKMAGTLLHIIAIVLKPLGTQLLMGFRWHFFLLITTRTFKTKNFHMQFDNMFNETYYKTCFSGINRM